MKYKKAKDVLPADLLRLVQNYVNGELLYIPQKKDVRMPWGSVSGTKKQLEERNGEIVRLYREGSSVSELVTLYHLSEDSIRKIIYTTGKSLQSEQEETAATAV